MYIKDANPLLSAVLVTCVFDQSHLLIGLGTFHAFTTVLGLYLVRSRVVATVQDPLKVAYGFTESNS